MEPKKSCRPKHEWVEGSLPISAKLLLFIDMKLVVVIFRLVVVADVTIMKFHPRGILQSHIPMDLRGSLGASEMKLQFRVPGSSSSSLIRMMKSAKVKWPLASLRG